MIFLINKYLKMFLDGTWLTLYIAVLGTIFGFILGYIVGIVQDMKIGLGDNIVKKSMVRLLKSIAAAYVEIFRDTPMIVQAMIIYYGIRQLGVNMQPVFAGILVTLLNTGAYMAETVRGGIGSIDIGQREGAWAMGMSPMKTMIYIVLPQAFKNIIPEMANALSLIRSSISWRKSSKEKRIMHWLSNIWTISKEAPYGRNRNQHKRSQQVFW